VSADLATLQDELAATAREIAKLLTQSPLDRDALAELDRKAGELRRCIRAAYPPRPVEDRYGSRLLSGG
jgi:hypothetical protein